MSKKKKIIIVITITLLLLAIFTFIYFNLIKEDKKTNNNNATTELENIEYTYDENGPGFFCSDEPLGSRPISYMIGEYVYCAISYELNGNKPGIHEIWAEYSLDEDVEYIETLDTPSTEWTLNEDGNKFHLITTRPTVYAEYFYQVKFRIKPTTKKDKVTITFKDIKYKDEDNNYYKTDDSVIELSIGKSTNYYYKNSKNNDEIVFYKLNSTTGYEEINKYTCENDSCYEYASQCTSYIDLDKGKMLIHDGDKAILYDFNKGVLGTYSQGVEDLENYFVVKDIKTEKYGIIDKDGKVIKELTSDGFGIKVAPCFNTDTYSLEHDLIVEKKDNKYGIVKITKDETIIEHNFDDIRLYNDKYFKAKIDDKWYLYNLNTKEKVIDEGYQELFIVTDEIIVVQIDNYLYIKDYQGNNLIEDKIEVLVQYNEGACCANVSGIYIMEEDNIIKINIDEEIDITENQYKQHQYEYNIKDKKLTKTN